jgi:hypothetical protein
VLQEILDDASVVAVAATTAGADVDVDGEVGTLLYDDGDKYLHMSTARRCPYLCHGAIAHWSFS